MPTVDVSFTFDEALITSIALKQAIRDYETVMLEDQGCKEGKPGTLGHENRLKLIGARNKIDSTWISA